MTFDAPTLQDFLGSFPSFKMTWSFRVDDDFLGCNIGGAKEPGVIYFPINWGAKEPQNLPNHRVVFETLRPRKLDSWYPKARRSQSEGPTVGPGAIVMVWIDMGVSQNWWILRDPSFETHSHLWCYQIFFDLKPYYWRHALRIIQTNTTQR